MKKNKIVFIAHPIKGDIEKNVEDVLKICSEIVATEKNVIPFAPYLQTLLYLDDGIKEERELGMKYNAEFFKRRAFDELWLTGDDITSGMLVEIRLAKKFKIPIKIRTLKLKKKLDEILK